MKDYVIRLETFADHAEVENLVRESFWNVYRPGCTEHYVLHHLRNNADFIPELCFVMEQDGRMNFLHFDQTLNNKQISQDLLPAI